MRQALLLLTCLAMTAVAYGDSTNLEGGVFIAHHPPDVQYSLWTDWCQKYVEEYALTSCEDQNNRIDLDGNRGESSVWYVLAAWTESKEWCGTEFGFGPYDPNIYGFIEWGPCSPGGNLEIPTDDWPGPNEGTALTTTDVPWSGNLVPVYYFAGYAYYTGIIPLGPNPATGLAGTGNCANPPQTWEAGALGGIGLFEDGIYVCPAEIPSVCCVESDCFLRTESECQSQQGTWHPGSYTCDPNPCPSGPERVCCVFDYCYVLTEEECDELGGVFLPYAEDCESDPCTVPTRHGSWGVIKAAYRLNPASSEQGTR